MTKREIERLLIRELSKYNLQATLNQMKEKVIEGMASLEGFDFFKAIGGKEEVSERMDLSNLASGILANLDILDKKARAYENKIRQVFGTGKQNLE